MTEEERKLKSREYNKRWRLKHRERLLVKERLWRERNREALRISGAEWRRANPDKCKAWSRECYQTKRDEFVAKKRAYNSARKEEINAKSREYRSANLSKVLARCAEYRKRNRETLREKNRLYSKENPGIGNANTMKRIAARINATPAWADYEEIKKLYKQAADISRTTGIPHVVDHIYPLQGRTVCGLHFEYNLRVVTESENCKKSNRLPTAKEVRQASEDPDELIPIKMVRTFSVSYQG